ncbi:hypothetical protein [Nocardia fluminea]|uniref:Uncharacterized protein n=1 Tax=Nocardia fluminea TaxID=134984 RepID=A0A2N3VGW4_9NOCA|nr:hypothetical protein [Nocardia fluminea]PKV80869.1 hypothetical protein ATK86_5306 [Nocardia fluminea]
MSDDQWPTRADPDDDPDAVWHDPDCRNGWLSPPDADVMRACPVCRPKSREVHDFAERLPSLRAQQAIAAQERKDQD